MNDAIAKVILGMVMVLVVAFFMAFFSGTLVWLLWPVAVNAAFPGLVANGVLAKSLSWWSAVCLAWLVAILSVRGGTSTNSN